MVRRGLGVVALAVVAVLGSACASPTLPLPPPLVPTIGPGAMAGQVHLSSGCGGVQDSAYVLVTNNNEPSAHRAVATVADTCGSWSLDTWANKGDTLEIQQIVGAEISDALIVQVH
jgi:hypothetical protein